jgi:5-methylcytosine-specific restriction endonuclease McrA
MRFYNTNADGESFDEATIEAVWQKAIYYTVLPPGFRKDYCGAKIQRNKYGIIERYGWEIDHIKPVEQGGTDDLSNLRPLHWENNRAKGDSYPDSAWASKVRS